MEGTEVTPVERLRHGAKNLVVEVIILSITRSRDSRKPTMLHVADGTASIELCAFADSHPELMCEGDILRVVSAYCTLYKGSLQLYVSKRGLVTRIGTFTMAYSEVPNMSELRFEVATTNAGTPLQVQEPGFGAAAQRSDPRRT